MTANDGAVLPPLLGTHISVAGGFHEAIRRGSALGCETMQIFTKSNRQWQGDPIEDDAACRFRADWAASAIGPIFVHAAYLINLASARDSVREKSCEALIDEVRRADLLGLPFVVFHPGSHGGDGDALGLQRLVDGLKVVLDATTDCRTAVALETMAGQGNCLGAQFEQLATVLAALGCPERVGVCLDSCHVHAAGYDVDSAGGVERMLAAFDATVGVQHLRALHLNDSRHPAGSRKDRHEHIGDGAIGDCGFAAILRDPRLAGLPMVLETPKTGEEMAAEDIRNLRKLRKLLAR